MSPSRWEGEGRRWEPLTGRRLSKSRKPPMSGFPGQMRLGRFDDKYKYIPWNFQFCFDFPRSCSSQAATWFFFRFSQKFPPQVATSLPRQFAVPAHVTDDKLVAELINFSLFNSSKKATTWARLAHAYVLLTIIQEMILCQTRLELLGLVSVLALLSG